MSDGSDGAGGVGGNDGAGNAGNDAAANADAIGSTAEALGAAAESVAAAVADALGSMATAAGLEGALGQVADALGLDAQDLQGILGAAVLGAITGGVPGAVMGVVNAVTGSSLSEAARSAVADNMPAAFQPLANAAIDQFASRVPGASTTLSEALASFADGALTNGKVPDLGDLSAVARSFSDLQSAANGFMGAVAQGDFSSAADAVAAIDGRLGAGLAQAAQVSEAVTAAVAGGHTAYAAGGNGPFGDAVEQVAVDTARAMVNR